jgi:spore cortex formation protein SpoVR/YcgB (stage V sporulation)
LLLTIEISAATTFKNPTVVWDDMVKDIKRVRDTLSRRRKGIEEEEALGDKVAKILEWIKQKDDPEQSMSKIETEVTSEGRSETYAQWFLNLHEYRAWSEGFRKREDMETQSEPVSPRVLWIKGFYGTGKTTIA